MKVRVIGAGLAGSECAFQLALRGIEVELVEMKPVKKTPAHELDTFGELVCSNSLKNKNPESASGLLKSELEELSSMLLQVAKQTEVPAGDALAVDRELFSKTIHEKIVLQKNIKILSREETSLDFDGITVVATGPLTSDSLAKEIEKKLGTKQLAFFDASSPIVEKESIDFSKAFWSGRYGKDLDYLNCPLSKDEYIAFFDAIINAEVAHLHEFEKNEIFEGCMPIEVLAKRGFEGMRFGPMKPVGLIDPSTGKMPFAVVQLRKENKDATLFSLVGFQTNLKFGEQKRVFSMIPALSNASFVKFGVMHRNTFINAPEVLIEHFCLKSDPNVFFAGQISGVEGYVESIASGMIVAIQIWCRLKNIKFPKLSSNTCIGALSNFILQKSKNFQPMNANYGIMNPIQADKNLKKKLIFERSMNEIKKLVEETKWN